jgi:DNA mismatch repair protein MutL
MLAVNWQSIDLAVAGAVSAPLVHRGTRQRQYFWVNGRPVRSGLISAAVGRAYGMRLPPGRHPLVALGIAVPPRFLDVNVHPRKQEIGFVHERAVFAAVQEAVDLALQRLDMDVLPWEAKQAEDWPDWPLAGSLSAESGIPYGDASPEAASQLWRPMGQVGNTFVVASGSEGLIVFDQHAAHESLLYTRLITAAEAAHELEEPFTLTLPAQQRRWLTTIQPILSEMGIELEAFGQDTLIVRSVPAFLAEHLQAGAFLDALAEARQRLTPKSSPEEARDQLGAAFACRSAIRAGEALREEQLQSLVDAMGQHRMPYTCPHGRPTYVMLSLSDLERRFLRLFPLDTSSGDC